MLLSLLNIIGIIVPIEIIEVIVLIDVIVLIVWFCQVRVDLSIPDHIWTDKRAAIAKRVDDLGDEFRPAMRKGWLAYIRKTYAVAASVHSVAFGQGEIGELVVPDDDAWWLWARVRSLASWPGFHIKYRCKSQFCVSE